MDHSDVNKQGGQIEDKRLWIGNLDPRITEYQLLKIIQTHGAIEKFDLLFHRTGPLAGQPRGYAFVTYKDQEAAMKAKGKLHNIPVGQKRISVMWAHSVTNEEMEKSKPEVHIPALAMSMNEKKTDRESQIQAIEAKLKQMERKTEEELRINDTVSSKPALVTQFQYNKSASITNNCIKPKRNERHAHKPYTKHKSRQTRR